MKKCPFCAEEIQDEAIKCRYCGSMLVPQAGPAARDEQVVLRIHPSYKPLLLIYLAAIGLSALALGLLSSIEKLTPEEIALGTAAVAVIVFSYAFAYHIRRNRTHYILTTQNLTIEVGIFARSATHIPLSKVQDVTVRRTLLGRLFNIGTIVVESAGASGRVPEINVDSPETVSRRILAQVSEETRAAGPGQM